MGTQSEAQAAAPQPGLPPRVPSRQPSRQASRRGGLLPDGATLHAEHHDKESVKSLRTLNITEEDGSVTTVDAKKLKRKQSLTVLQGVMPDPDAENIALLKRIQERLARVGLASPAIEVRYEDMHVETMAAVGDKQIPTVMRAVKGSVKNLLGTAHQRPLRIIEGASGVLRPGRFTLVLAPPGSGKTTFLKALAGRLRGTDLRVGGKVLYNGHTFDEFVPERSAAYISQVDLHYGELTVRETFEFAAECQSRSYARDMMSELAAREEAMGIVPDPELDAYMRASAWGGRHSLATEVMLHMLGLQVCADTVVGNAMMRGISGGQKKRVTSGEALVGHAKVLYADEISTGLDSNTTHLIAKSLRNICHVMNGTMLVALLQPPPETFDLFDDVMLLASGMVLYHGPREGVLPFFRAHLGFDCPTRKSVADFLQEIAVPSDQQKYWEDATRPYKYVTAQTIRTAFWKSEASEQQRALLAAPPSTDGHADRSSATGGSASDASSDSGGLQALTTEKFGASYWRLFRANFLRALRLQLRSSLFMYVRIFQVILMAFVVATIYINVGKNTLDDGNILMGAQFYSLIYMLIGGTVEMHLVTARLPVFWKQREMRFYPGWCWAVPTFVFRLPYALLDATLWSLIIYWAVGFDNSWRFLVFWLFMFLTCAWATSLFQAIACICRTETVSSAVGSFFLLVFMATGGFLITKGAIPAWWIAAYWSNPWSYITQGLAVNEFTGPSWQKTDPSDPNSGMTIGEEVLSFRGFGTEYWWVWIGVGATVFSIFVNVAAFVLAATFLPGIKSKPVISTEALEELDLNRTAAPTKLPASVKKDIQSGAKRSGSALNLADLDEDEEAPAANGNDRHVTVAVLDMGKPAGERITNGSAREASSGDASPTSTPSLPGAAALAPDSSVRSKLPFQPLSVTFKDISYDVPRPKSALGEKQADKEVGEDTLRLLRHVNGAFRPGVLTALMGASGAGKTTLMDVLAGRKTGGTVHGDVRVNGFPKNQKTFSRVTGYVEQEDVHLPQATVSEALAFSAVLRLPSTVDEQTRREFIDEVMELTELDRLRHAHIGMLGVSGLSVEQRKRLTIAVELVANPSIVFMDEPTTGLDARAASLVMSTVRATVNTGRTVVCTIHQPSIDIFEAFDELLVLKPGGVCVYFGPLGHESSDLISYFSAIGGVAPIPPRHNPANWMLEQTSPASENRLGIDFGEVYRTSTLAKEMEAVINATHEPAPGAQDLTIEGLKVRGPIFQYMVLLKRLFQMYNRLPDYQLVRLAVTLLVGFVFGSLAWKQGSDTSTLSGVLNIAGLLFAATLFVGFTNAMTVQSAVEIQRAVFYREHAAGMYGALPMAIAQGNVEIPYLVVQCVVYSCIVYWMVGFQADAAKFFWFMFIFGLALAIFTAYGMMCINLTPEKGLAGLFMSFFFGFWNLMCGFLIPAASIPGWWIWMYYLDPLSWVLQGLIVTQMGDLNDTYIEYNGETQSVPQFLDDRFDYRYSMRWPCIAVLIGFILVFRLTSIYSLKFLNFQNR